MTFRWEMSCVENDLFPCMVKIKSLRLRFLVLRLQWTICGHSWATACMIECVLHRQDLCLKRSIRTTWTLPAPRNVTSHTRLKILDSLGLEPMTSCTRDEHGNPCSLTIWREEKWTELKKEEHPTRRNSWHFGSVVPFVEKRDQGKAKYGKGV